VPNIDYGIGAFDLGPVEFVHQWRLRYYHRDRGPVEWQWGIRSSVLRLETAVYYLCIPLFIYVFTYSKMKCIVASLV